MDLPYLVFHWEFVSPRLHWYEQLFKLKNRNAFPNNLDTSLICAWKWQKHIFFVETVLEWAKLHKDVISYLGLEIKKSPGPFLGFTWLSTQTWCERVTLSLPSGTISAAWRGRVLDLDVQKGVGLTFRFRKGGDDGIWGIFMQVS